MLNYCVNITHLRRKSNVYQCHTDYMKGIFNKEKNAQLYQMFNII